MVKECIKNITSKHYETISNVNKFVILRSQLYARNITTVEIKFGPDKFMCEINVCGEIFRKTK